MNATASKVPDPLVERLIRGIAADGLSLSGLALRVAVDYPEWERRVGAHDWRYHVPPAVRGAWASLSLTTRLCVYETAEMIALDAPVGGVMLTGGPRGAYLP